MNLICVELFVVLVNGGWLSGVDFRLELADLPRELSQTGTGTAERWDRDECPTGKVARSAPSKDCQHNAWLSTEYCNTCDGIVNYTNTFISRNTNQSKKTKHKQNFYTHRVDENAKASISNEFILNFENE